MAEPLFDSAVLVALIAGGGVVLTAAGALAGAWLNAQVRKREVALLAYERAEKIYANSIDNLQEEIADLRSSRDADRTETALLRVRVRGLEADRDGDRRRMDLLIDYVRALQRMLRANQIEYPPAPAELDLLGTDPNLPTVT